MNSDDQWRIKGFGGPGQKKCAGLHVRYSRAQPQENFKNGPFVCREGGILGAIIHSVFNLSGGAEVNLVVSSNYLQFKKEKKDFAFGLL